MRWVKIDLWKLIISITGLLLILIFMVWIPATLVDAHGKTSELSPTPTVKVSPTVNVTATMNALQEDKLRQEIQQLQYQNEQTKNQNSPDLFVWFPVWLRTNIAIIVSTLVVVIGALIGLFRWFGDRRSEREKRAEERFQAIVVGLGSKDVEAKVGAAIMLRTFLQRGYKKFYRQVFDLTVAHLRLRKVSFIQSEQPNVSNLSLIDVSGRPLQHEPNISIDSLSQALINAFKLSYPLARKQATKARVRGAILNPYSLLPDFLIKLFGRDDSLSHFYLRTLYVPQFLDATNIQLDDASLLGADLEDVSLEQASLRRANLLLANLRYADLRGTDLSKADFRKTNLSGANFSDAILVQTNIEKAQSLKGTDLRGVIGLTEDQLKACKEMGAIIDEDTKAKQPQPTDSVSTHQESNNGQASSVPTSQVNIPPPSTDGDSTASSQLSPEP